MREIENASPTLSKWTAAVVRTRFGGKPAFASCAENAIEKQPACAASVQGRPARRLRIRRRSSETSLPTTRLQHLLRVELGNIDPAHGLAQFFRALGDYLRLVIVRGRPDDRSGALVGVRRLEDAGAHKDSLGAKLHHQRGIGGRGNPAG